MLATAQNWVYADRHRLLQVINGLYKHLIQLSSMYTLQHIQYRCRQEISVCCEVAIFLWSHEPHIRTAHTWLRLASSSVFRLRHELSCQMDDWRRVQICRQSLSCAPHQAMHLWGITRMCVSCASIVSHYVFVWEALCDNLNSWAPLIEICGFVAHRRETHPVSAKWENASTQCCNEQSFLLPGGPALSRCWLCGEVSITSSVCGGLKLSLLSAL